MLSPMDLRDRFAAHFAAALVDAFAEPDQVARRAYDLAEAMLEERARRFDADAEASAAIPEERFASDAPPRPVHYLALLDEPEPMPEVDPGFDDDLDPRLLDPPYDPSWDLEARWSEEAAPPRPGLARTQPEIEEAAKKERSA
jgi:hypothetical protein